MLLLIIQILLLISATQLLCKKVIIPTAVFPSPEPKFFFLATMSYYCLIFLFHCPEPSLQARGWPFLIRFPIEAYLFPSAVLCICNGLSHSVVTSLRTGLVPYMPQCFKPLIYHSHLHGTWSLYFNAHFCSTKTSEIESASLIIFRLHTKMRDIFKEPIFKKDFVRTPGLSHHKKQKEQQFIANIKPNLWFCEILMC